MSGEEEEEVRRRNLKLEEELKYLRETLGLAESSVPSSPELTSLISKYFLFLPRNILFLNYSQIDTEPALAPRISNFAMG